MKHLKSLYQLEQARQALMLADMPKHKKAAKAEQLGDYRHAQSLWKQVADNAPNNSITQKYAHISIATTQAKKTYTKTANASCNHCLTSNTSLKKSTTSWTKKWINHDRQTRQNQ